MVDQLTSTPASAKKGFSLRICSLISSSMGAAPLPQLGKTMVETPCLILFTAFLSTRRVKSE